MPLKCEVEKDVNLSNRWFLKIRGRDYNLRECQQLAIKGEKCPLRGISFDSKYGIRVSGDDVKDNSYRFFFGPGFSHSAQLLANSNHNITSALTRQTCDPDADGELGRLQTRFYSQPTRLIRRLRDALEKHFSDSSRLEAVDFESELLKYADLPHPKRKLRLQAALEIVDNNYFLVVDRFKRRRLISKVTSKFKKFEWAKPKKFGRLIVDLSVVGSLLSGFAADRVKYYQSTFSDDVEFIKNATPEMLRMAFKKLLDPDQTYFCYFSDDSCGAVRCADGVFMFNMDISSCDGSHTDAFFDWYASTFVGCPVLNELIGGSISQLRLPLTVCDCNGRPLAQLHHNLKSPYATTLYSGSTLTTLTNNFANLVMGTMLKSVPWHRYTKSECTEVILRTVRQVGYLVTIQDCSSNPQQLQFLKHSPTDDGEPWLNLGVIMRSLGVSKNEIPVKGKSIKQRARLFNAQLVNGFLLSGSTPLTRVLAEKYAGVTSSKSFANYMLSETLHNQHEVRVIPAENVLRRYGLEIWEFEELLSLVRESRHGDLIRCSASDKIFELDYSYSAPVEHSISIPVVL